ncbi:MAG: NAD(P)-binding domain-containing protein [Defluviitaleaceae bacterium]|nr:NAD(P)-binding domain-containing protein [Defluviitaleaceae bacterium]
MKIGFIGLGIMGKPMSQNLIKAGYDVLLYDKTNPAGSREEIAKTCGIIITMLPDGPDVERVVMGEGGLLDHAPSGTIIIDMSSIAPGAAQKIHKACAGKGVVMLDAPVSGGQPKAIDGTLSIMVGGCEQTFEKVKPVLLAMGASAIHCGDIGAGNTAKLANNIIVAMNIAAVCEAFTLSNKAGVDPNKVFEAIKGGLAGSTVMNAKIPMILADNFEPGFKIDLHIKDLRNAVNTGEQVSSPLPFTKQVMDIYQKLSDDGYGQKDHSAMWHYFQSDQC